MHKCIHAHDMDFAMSAFKGVSLLLFTTSIPSSLFTFLNLRSTSRLNSFASSELCLFHNLHPLYLFVIFISQSVFLHLP